MSHYIGIDISKMRLDIDWLGECKAYENKENSIKKLIKQFVVLKKKTR